MWSRAKSAIWRNESGAIAPTFALSLFALVAVGGIGFDYARLAAMDSELQNAADQAALAAASQLNGEATACSRASAAAVNLVSNDTLFANEANSVPDVVVAAEATCDATGSIRFWQNSTKTTAATTGTNAKFVEVQVTARTARYALTPIVGAINSGAIDATAFAGLGSAICKVPPVMICNPDEPTGNILPGYDFDAASRVGKGLKLVTVGNGPSAWAPGNFGYLDTGSSTANPNVELREALGWLTAPGDCSSILGVKTRTGAGTPVTQAINTRFDIYEKANVGNGNAASCPSGGSCPPSINTVKDVVRPGNAAGGGKCGLSNNEWELPSVQYLPTSATTDMTSGYPTGMGHPRDKCHAFTNGVSAPCTGKIGNGDWDRNAYFFVNYGWNSAAWPTNTNTATNPLASSPTRYQVYLWEIAHRGETIGAKVILGNRALGAQPSSPIDHDAPICSALQTPSSSGLVPGGSTVDRRRISAAVINCNAYDVHGGGGTVYPVLKWIELFLVEPSVNRSRTDANDVYVEIISETTLGNAGATAGQVVRKDKPYLIE